MIERLQLIIVALAILTLGACQPENTAPLPILGHVNITESGDTIYHTIPTFSFVNQDSSAVTSADMSEYVYISDFFFISCPSICPKVKQQMLRVYKKYQDHPRVKMLSHTIDPKRDTPERLKKYAQKLDVNTDKWIFLTGDKATLFDMADKYFVSALEDPSAPGGFDHSGKIILVDTHSHVRAFAEGTDPDDVTDFLKDIDRLLAEYED